MTNSIPDGISFFDLENFAAQATRREEEAVNAFKEAKGPRFDGKTQREVEEIAFELCEKAIEECNDPIVHKIIMLQALMSMIDWHTRVGAAHFAQGENPSGISWLRDAGKFQACMDILMNIQVGPDDFAVQ